jgi:hypothetical protein
MAVSRAGLAQGNEALPYCEGWVTLYPATTPFSNRKACYRKSYACDDDSTFAMKLGRLVIIAHVCICLLYLHLCISFCVFLSSCVTGQGAAQSWKLVEIFAIPDFSCVVLIGLRHAFLLIFAARWHFCARIATGGFDPLLAGATSDAYVSILLFTPFVPFGLSGLV